MTGDSGAWGFRNVLMGYDYIPITERMLSIQAVLISYVYWQGWIYLCMEDNGWHVKGWLLKQDKRRRIQLLGTMAG